MKIKYPMDIEQIGKQTKIRLVNTGRLSHIHWCDYILGCCPQVKKPTTHFSTFDFVTPQTQGKKTNRAKTLPTLKVTGP